MKLNPKHVHFIAPFMDIGLSDATPRFVGKEKNIQLRETAFVVEGSVLKVRFLRIEYFFQRAITEYTSLTIPYQRMQETRHLRWPFSRLVFLILFLALPCLACLTFFAVPYYFPEPRNPAVSDIATFVFLMSILGTVMSFYLFARIRPRYKIVYLDIHNKRRSLLFRVSSKPLIAQLNQQLQQYVAAARQYSWTPHAV